MRVSGVGCVVEIVVRTGGWNAVLDAASLTLFFGSLSSGVKKVAGAS